MLNVAKNPQNHFLYLDFLRGVASIAVLLLYPLIFVGLLLGAARFMLRDYLEIGQFISADTSTSLLLGLFLILSNIGGGVVTFHTLNTPIWSLFFEIIAYTIFAAILLFHLYDKSVRKILNTMISVRYSKVKTS